MLKLLTPALLLLAAPAFAQITPPAAAASQPATAAPAADPNAPVPVKAGDTIYDPAGTAVGTIESTDGANAVLATGTVKVTIPANAIVGRDKGPTIALTKAQVEQQAAAATPK